MYNFIPIPKNHLIGHRVNFDGFSCSGKQMVHRVIEFTNPAVNLFRLIREVRGPKTIIRKRVVIFAHAVHDFLQFAKQGTIFFTHFPTVANRYIKCTDL